MPSDVVGVRSGGQGDGQGCDVDLAVVGVRARSVLVGHLNVAVPGGGDAEGGIVEAVALTGLCPGGIRRLPVIPGIGKRRGAAGHGGGDA